MIQIMRQHEIAPGVWGQPIRVSRTISTSIADDKVAELNDIEKCQRRRRRVRYFTVTETGITAN